MEIDNAGQGMAHARVAGVDDASAVYYNPAAMAEVERYGAKVGFQYVDPKTKLDHSTGEHESVNETLPVPHLYSVSKLEDMGLAIGLGVFSNFGHATSWEIISPVRHVATDTKLKTYTVNVSAAMSLEVLSIGVGLNYMNAHAEYDNLHVFPDMGADGYSLVDVKGTAVGFNAGVLFKITDAIRFGATYRSAMKTDLSGEVTLENVPGGGAATNAGHYSPLFSSADGGTGANNYTSDADTSMDFPAIISAGLNINVTEAFSIEVDVDLVQWSSFEEVKFTFASPHSIGGKEVLPASSTMSQKWEDTMVIKLGASFKLDKNNTFRFGAYSDPSPVPDDTFCPRVPDADRTAITVGYGYQAGDHYFVDASFAFVMMGDRNISNNVGDPYDDVSGSYTNSANIFGVTVGYQF